MHPLLAFAGRTLLILALVLTGPGFSARAMAAMHGGHGVVAQPDAAKKAASAEAVQHAAPKAACHEVAMPPNVATGRVSSHDHAAMVSDQDRPVTAMSIPSSGSDCCSYAMGCECDCAPLLPPGAVAGAAVMPAQFGDALDGKAAAWRIGSPRARLNRPPIA